MIRAPAFRKESSHRKLKLSPFKGEALWLAFCSFAAFLVINAAVLLLIRVQAGVPVSESGYLLFVFLPGVLVSVLLVFFLRKKTVVYSYVAPFILAFYGAQSYILWNSPADKFDAVTRAREQGLDAVPSVHPLVFFWKDAGAIFDRWESEELSLPLINGRPVLPLAGISKAITYYCKEADPFLVYESDRHGFNNPDAAWDPPVELVFVGDSFTQGACVPAEKHFTGILRETFPGLLNLGMGGNGPLTALATFQEYVVDLRPKHVFWLYFEGNDILVRPELDTEDKVSDIERELTIPILRSYLDNPQFRQGLKENQRQVDQTLRSIVELAFQAESMKRAARRTGWGSFYEPFAEKVTLAPLAKRMFLALPRKHIVRARGLNNAVFHRNTAEADTDIRNLATGTEPRHSTEKSLAALRTMLQRMQKTVASWNGQFHLIYLPEITHFRFGPHPLRDKVLSLANDLGISVIDMVAVFDREPDPQNLFAFGVHGGGHYNGRGYRLVAKAIAEKLPTSDPASKTVSQ